MSLQNNLIMTSLGTMTGIAGGVLSAYTMNKVLGYGSQVSILNGIALTYGLARYYYGNLDDIQPSAVIGGIPLGTVEEQELIY